MAHGVQTSVKIIKWQNKVFYIEYKVLGIVKAVLSIGTFSLKGGTSFQQKHSFNEKISVL